MLLMRILGVVLFFNRALAVLRNMEVSSFFNNKGNG